MTIPVWQPGTVYFPGEIVRRTSSTAATATQVPNGSFEEAIAGESWTALGSPYGSAWTFPDDTGEAFNAYDGTHYARYITGAGGEAGRLASDLDGAVVAGQSVTARCYIQLRGPGLAVNYTHGGRIILQWRNDADAVIAETLGNRMDVTTAGGIAGLVWRESVATAVAPIGATKVRVILEADTVALNEEVHFDDVTWTHVTPPTGTTLVFRATQAASGISGTSEPVWPTVVGESVVDNEVTWTATTGNGLVWETKPILVSGATEPTWPTAAGGAVKDNTIQWQAITRRVEDERCPNSKVVAIASSKVFAGDNDIVAFSATVNPLDWSTPEDAGYLPFGLQTYGSTPVSALGLYRSNLVVFNSRGFQMWQVDEDPANHAILDAAPVGCPYHRSVQPVSNDLVFLTEVGIRNIGIAGASTNLQAGHFGKQIDPMVQALLATYGPPTTALYYAGAGQYWLIFGDEAFVLTMNGGKEDMSWSRYTFPGEITDWTVLDDKLVLRAGNLIWEYSEDTLQDDERLVDEVVTGTPFDGYVAWPYLDFGQIGREKQMYGFDLVMDGECDVVFGYAQENFALATTPYTVEGDTLTGQVIPMPLAGPSFQLRLTFTGGQSAAWEVQAASIYVNDLRRGT